MEDLHGNYDDEDQGGKRRDGDLVVALAQAREL
jgi:hypothetical protein